MQRMLRKGSTEALPSEGEEMNGYQILYRVHYDFFMANPRFWYDANLRAADQIIVRLMSELRSGSR